jgi:hypothetical protein
MAFMLQLLSNFFLRHWVLPVAMLGCVLPIQSFSIQQHWINVSVYHNYSGVAIIVMVLLFGIYSFLQAQRQKATHPFTDTLIGGYLAAWAIFVAWQTITLFPAAEASGSGIAAQAKAFPREGLLLLLIAAAGLIYRAMRKPAMWTASKNK